ncbi:hypothetical protein BDV18DRAFT_127758 [Aspergillus unguis]
MLCTSTDGIVSIGACFAPFNSVSLVVDATGNSSNTPAWMCSYCNWARLVGTSGFLPFDDFGRTTVDYESKDSLRQAFSGVETVLSFLAIPDPSSMIRCKRR